MKNKNIWIAVAALSAIMTMVAFTGCSGPGGLGGRSDSQISTDVQSKILGDAAVQNKQLTISSDKGVVTLSGNVNSDSERQAAANDAAQVSGVKTVINNLQVANAAAEQPQQPSTAQASQSESASAATPRRASRRVFHPARSNAEPSVAQDTVTSNSDIGRNASSSPSNVASAPVVPPPPATVTIPEGTPISITLTDPLSSGTNHD